MATKPSNVTPLPRPPSNKRLVAKLRRDALRTAVEWQGASAEVERIREDLEAMKSRLVAAIEVERWSQTAHHAAVLELRREAEQGQ